ncbi:hypothetical protein WN51_07099 [Melipona quadrifasciata]|uniref:DUF7041 domain-containing protein n=1 Tax=Melipona quadrifasciata TaxID=166423 RepID=A0A0M8ZT67_9HYME|nr:hypothetical protein WN51_07099 [Melipona quadrifasciata]
MKYSCILTYLDTEHMDEVSDIIESPPERDKYDMLKNEIIRRLSISQAQKIQRLLKKENMGDRTPSQFLQHIRTLAGKAVSDEFLRTIAAYDPRLHNSDERAPGRASRDCRTHLRERAATRRTNTRRSKISS